MDTPLKTYLVYTLAIAINCLAWPARAASDRPMPVGQPTADRAAATQLQGSDEKVSPFAVIQHSLAYSDTTDDYPFPEEEEQKHLWRDVAVWLIAAGFVAYFIIKVFLEGDKDQPPTQEPGKQPPPATLIVPQPSR